MEQPGEAARGDVQAVESEGLTAAGVAPRSALRLAADTLAALVANRVLQMSAALAYWSALSLAPLVVITLGITGMVVDRRVVQDELAAYIEQTVGTDGAALVRTLGEEERGSGAGLWATGAGFVLLLLGASAAFVQLQDGINVIWGARVRPRGGLLLFLRTRLISVLMVFCLGAVLLASLLVNTIVSAMGHRLGALVASGEELAVVAQVASTFALMVVLFALLYRWLPDVFVTWRQAWAGALLTSGLFHVGAWAIGQYIGRAAVGSAYGAAGSLVVLLVWIYFGSLFVFTGAQFAAVLARRPAGPPARR
jgi:membrane protein